MFQRASLGAFEKSESAEMGGGRGASLLLHLGIVGSAYNTPQQMIRLSDEKESFNFLFFVIIMSIFGIRGDRILLILGGQVWPGGSFSCPLRSSKCSCPPW